LRYLVVQLVLGCLAAAVAALVVMGLVVTFQVSIGAATGGPVPVFGSGPGMVTGRTVALFVLPGLVLAFLAVSGLAGISVLDRLWWDRCCRPSAGELTREVDRLHGTLEEVVHAVDQERRRIERDIHDGIQQQVVALAILLARVDRERDAQERQELLERSRTMTQQVLDELRAVSLRTFPASLDRDGLVSALEALCDRTTVPTDLLLTAVPESDPGTRTATPQAAETAAYFVASEAVTNALKHADCGRLRLEVTQSAAELRISIEDDGTGGADPGGPGLAGIRSRVASQGGRLEVSSPIGGPTRISAVIPCA
jgi:signal transduction histidine kinase